MYFMVFIKFIIYLIIKFYYISFYNYAQILRLLVVFPSIYLPNSDFFKALLSSNISLRSAQLIPKSLLLFLGSARTQTIMGWWTFFAFLTGFFIGNVFLIYFGTLETFTCFFLAIFEGFTEAMLASVAADKF